MKIDALVREKVLMILRLRDPSAKTVTADQELRADLGLDSLDLAQLGAEIENALGRTIFGDVAVGAILTIGDLVATCEELLAEPDRVS